VLHEQSIRVAKQTLPLQIMRHLKIKQLQAILVSKHNSSTLLKLKFAYSGGGLPQECADIETQQLKHCVDDSPKLSTIQRYRQLREESVQKQ